MPKHSVSTNVKPHTHICFVKQGHWDFIFFVQISFWYKANAATWSPRPTTRASRWNSATISCLWRSTCEGMWNESGFYKKYASTRQVSIPSSIGSIFKVQLVQCTVSMFNSFQFCQFFLIRNCTVFVQKSLSLDISSLTAFPSEL